MFPVWYWSRSGYYYFSDDDGYFPERASYAKTVSGGVETGGTADPPEQTYVHSVSGGLSSGGSATMIYAPAGQLFGGFFPTYYYARRAYPGDYWPEEIGTTSKTATGGLTLAGSATEAFDLSPIDATGGITVGGGAGVSTPGTEREASGGINLGGTSGVHFISTPEGGLIVNGTAGFYVSGGTAESGYFPTHTYQDRYFTEDFWPEPNLSGSYLYEWTPIGGLEIAGESGLDLSQGTIDATGGLSVGGTAAELLVMSVNASGGLSISGEAERPGGLIGYLAEGGLETGGEAGWTFTLIRETSGGLALAGTVDYGTSDPVTIRRTASGGLDLEGSITPRYRNFYSGTGGLEIAGEAEAQLPFDIGIGGSAEIEWTQTRESDGGLHIGGAMLWWATLYDVQCDGTSEYVVVGYETDRDGRAHEIRQVCAAPDKKGVHWGDHWFVCPVNGTSHLISEGAKIGGRYYSKEAAWDIMQERSK